MESYHKCIKCQAELPSNSFSIRSNGKRNNVCRDCQKEYRQKHYRKNKQYYKNKNKDNRKRLTSEVNELKNYSCTDCGEKYEPFCMDFDHISDNKYDAVAKMIHNTHSLERIKEEISKTELVCVLCHKTRTYLRLQNRDRMDLPAQQRNRKYVDHLKAAPCASCHKICEPWQMEFHHLPEFEKKNSISIMVVTCYAIKTIQREIDKCQLLCSLCHRRETAKSWWG